MKKIKRIIALILSVSIFLSNGWIESLAAERVHKEYNNEFYEDTATETDAQCATESDGALDSENSILLNYLVVDKPSITTTDTQNILVGLGDGNVVFDNAVLYYKNEESGTEYSSYAKSVDSESALFEILIDKSYTSGKYIITAVEYMAGETSHTIYLCDAGIRASFGVDDIIETEADAYVEDVVDEMISDAVIVSDDGVVTAQEMENAVLAASDGAVMAKNKNEIVIVLDPGHGTPNGDPGATYEWNGVTYIERDLNLKIAEYCKEELEKYNGVKVYMTRTTNNNGLTLSAPEGEVAGPLVKFAADLDADIFVSIHNNSATAATANGSEVYYPNANYNPEMSKNAKELSNKILSKLSECGLTNRGAKIRDDSGNVQYYPDGSLGDYYGVIRQSKLCGFPGIIIEHAFVTNQSDAENFLGSDDKLKKLGQADAAALIEYFGLTQDSEYKEDAATLTVAQNNPDGSYTVVVSGVNAAGKVEVQVTNKRTGQIKDYGTIGQGGNWYARFDINDFEAFGSYLFEAYVVRENGTRYKVGETEIEAACANKSEITIKNADSSNGTFDVIISDIESPNGISKVQLLAWSDSDMGNQYLYDAKKQADGTYSVQVNLKNHKNHYGSYTIQAFVTDTKGIRVNTAAKYQDIVQPASKVSAFDPGDQNTYILIAENIPSGYDVKNVKFGVWHQGLSDLKWYEGSLDSYGRWLALMPISDYGKSGSYYTDAYVTLSDGQFIKIGSSSFEVSAPTATTIYVTNENRSGGTFDIIVSGINTASGVSSVRIPVWSEQDLSDLYWYNAERQSDGTYVAHANIKNHKYNYGVYAMQAYIKANNGVEVVAVSKCHDFAKPTPKVSTFQCDNEFNYILIAEDIPKGDLVTSVRFGVWNQGLSDLKWYQAGKDEFGRWLAVVGVSEYAKSGTYYGDAYMTLKDGSTVKLGGTSFNVSSPTVNKMYVDNADNIGGTFDIKIEGVNCIPGIESIRVPVWSAVDLKDIHWYDAKKESDGNYVVHVDISNHKNNYATYAMQVYIKAKNGVENIAASQCYTFKQPEEKLYKIMGSNGTSLEQMVRYYNSYATYPAFYATTDAPTIQDFCKIYIEECNAEGVKAEVAFCQAMKETGFLRFGGVVDISQLNFAGIGATDDGGTPATFTSVREGVRAQVQHLKAYASDEPLVNACVDPRFVLVTRETAQYVEWLGIQENPYGKGWASAKEYGYSLRKGYIEVLLSK
ncbi:MAG: GBS Bsp-like repeat-containing protein [Clostridium sp.]|nr:GBS Bsp-like repeat-containing protein [Clostridium sp.]MCM1208560.1 GBS Bsp-like repeat-containing protein [Ruminococcus sp.]